MTHIIHKLRWEVAFNEASPRAAVDAEVSELSNSSAFQQKLEDLFSALCPDQEWISLDKLDIELGQISAKNWQKELEEKLLEELKNKIKAKKPSPKATALKEKERLLEVFLAFVKTGNLPKSAPKEIADVKAFLKWIQAKAKQRQIRLKAVLQSHFSAFKNDVEAISHWPLNTFWALVFEKEKASLQSLKEAKEWQAKLLFSEEAVHVFRQDVWQGALNNELFKTTVKNKAKQWLAMAFSSANAKEKTALKAWLKTQQELPLPDIKSLEKASNKKEKTEEVAAEKNEIKSDQKREYFLRNAGLVLIAPFLPGVFKSLGFLKEKEISQIEKALAVLTFLDQGKPEETPLDNVLYKVLLGLPTEQVLLPAKRLSKKQMAETEAVLTSAIAHWKALKNTSPAGLREGFFSREGILNRTETEWKLRVETKAHDVLLGFLPWSIGIIKLPWMPKPLYVEWG